MAAATMLKNPKSRHLGNGLTDRHDIWHGDAIRQSWRIPQFVRHLNNPRWQRLPFLKNHHTSAAISAISTKFGMVMQFDPLNRYKFLKSMMRQLLFWQIQNRNISATVWSISTFGTMMHSGPPNWTSCTGLWQMEELTDWHTTTAYTMLLLA